MTSDTDTHLYTDPSDRSGPTEGTPSTTETARSEAQNVTSTAVQSGGQVLDTAKSEASEVVSQAGQTARDLFDQVRDELTDQAGTQQHRVAGGLRELAEELDRMAGGSGRSGLAGSLVKQASERSRTVADWIGEREPGDLVTDVKHYAARKPGAFLAAAAALGFLGARLTRGLAAGERSPAVAPRPSTTPSGVSDGGLSSGASPAAPGYRVVDDVPTVTTISHGEPVSYPSAAAGTAAESLSTAVPTPEHTVTDDDITRGRA